MGSCRVYGYSAEDVQLSYYHGFPLQGLYVFYRAGLGV